MRIMISIIVIASAIACTEVKVLIPVLEKIQRVVRSI